MAEAQANEYLRALKYYKDFANSDEKPLTMDQSLFTYTPSTDFSLTLKAYWEANGLSARMFEGGSGPTYMVKGPMGKSLGVK